MRQILFLSSSSGLSSSREEENIYYFITMLWSSFYSIAQKSKNGSFTFIHSIEELIEIISLTVVEMLFPGFSVLAAQQDQFSLLAPHRAKMGNLHNYRPGEVHVMEIWLGSENSEIWIRSLNDTGLKNILYIYEWAVLCWWQCGFVKKAVAVLQFDGTFRVHVITWHDLTRQMKWNKGLEEKAAQPLRQQVINAT